MAAYEIKKGDRLPALEANLKSNGSAITDLGTATSIVFEFQLADRSAPKRTGTATLVDGTTGRVRYSWATGDTDTTGAYHGHFVVTYSSGAIMSVPSGPSDDNPSGYIDFLINAGLTS